MTTLLCRICWNSEGWRRPTGEAARLESSSYVAEHGFGHEEWLFNYEWILNGRRCAFIQAINSSRRKYAGHNVSLLLYTRAPDGLYREVTTIPEASVLTEQECQEVAVQYQRRGWIKQMKNDLDRIGVSTRRIDEAAPHELTNIGFAPERILQIYDPPRPFADQDVFSLRYRRYRAFQLANADVVSPPKAATAPPMRGRRPSDAKNTDMRPRRGTVDGIVDPRHDRLQNDVREFLIAHCKDVEMERNWVDLRATIDGNPYFFEVKIAATARRCIREAIGQLLEYAHYPDQIRMLRFVVVGDTAPMPSDVSYLNLLQKTYGLKLSYAYYRRASKTLIGFPPARGE